MTRWDVYRTPQGSSYVRFQPASRCLELWLPTGQYWISIGGISESKLRHIKLIAKNVVFK